MTKKPRLIKWEAQILDRGEEDEETPKIINTFFGNYQIDTKLNPYDHFQFWVGHTTFIINGEVEEKLKNTYGVEFLKVISPYRFMMAPGEMFGFGEVRQEIETVLNCATDELSILMETEARDKIRKVISFLKEEKQPWLLIVLPNGKFKHATGDEVEKQRPFFDEVIKVTKGLMLEGK